LLQVQHFIDFFIKFNFGLLVKRAFVLLNVTFAMVIRDLISHSHLESFLIEKDGICVV